MSESLMTRIEFRKDNGLSNWPVAALRAV